MDGLSKLDYPERLRRLNLPTLAHRRKRGDMMEVYKHFNTYDRCTLSPSFKPRERETRQHNFQLLTSPPKDGQRGLQSNSFYYRVARVWNFLPHDVVSAKEINSFKNALDNFWKDDPAKYDHKHQTIDEEG